MEDIEKYNKTGYIAAIARGHNAGVCLLKDGEVVFSIEEERLSRKKYDGGPYASMVKILEYTDKIDYLVVAHTQSLSDRATGRVDYSGDDVYSGLARKLGLIDQHIDTLDKHPQVIDLSHIHHKLHAACAFYRSGFENAVAVIVDGAGTFIPINNSVTGDMTVFEVESIFQCDYPNDIYALYKHYGTGEATPGAYFPEMDSSSIGEPGKTHEAVFSDKAGIVKVYEAVTQYCGFSAIEAGKTMGLFPYGKENDEIPPLFDKNSMTGLSNRNFIKPTYPNGAYINHADYKYFNNHVVNEGENLTHLENRRDLAYALQTQTQKASLDLIRKAVKDSGCKNVVFSGGYGLNCVANYYYLEQLKDEGINFYVEPISNDAGTAIGAAILVYKDVSEHETVDHSTDGLYLGFEYDYSNEEIIKTAEKYNAEVSDATNEDIIDLITSKNIVACFQGRSEAGPRALGNRSILYDPTDPNGKDHVNKVKRREYFRPFAGSILQDDVHDWFDLRGMDDTPYMMYAVNCKEGVKEKIPSIIHVDGTCRIQTVTKESNPNYYNLIKTFKDRTGVPIIFNTSFNLGGEPLVETLDDAIRTLANSEIEYLYLPEYNKLITFKN